MVDYLSLLNELALKKLNFSVTNHNSDKSSKKVQISFNENC
jgi:hypothetical protein